MDKFDREQLYNTAWKHWGADMQMDMLIEEMAELTQAILKTRRNGVVFSASISEELADVIICMEQVLLKTQQLPISANSRIMLWDEIESIKERKLRRLKDRLLQSMTEKHGDE